MSNTVLFIEAAQAIFGSRWQSELARQIGKDDRTVRRYAAGDSPIPDDVLKTMQGLLAERRDQLDGLIERFINENISRHKTEALT